MTSINRMEPKVSIVINNYNYGHFLRNAIDSALNQTYSNTEVIVVDDGSTDNSPDLIKSYGTQIKPVFKPNGGQASAFNAGFAESEGEIVCFLDADDVFLPEKVKEIVNRFGDRPDLEWCFHTLQQVDANLNPINQSLTDAVEPANLCQEYDLRGQLTQGKPPKRFPYPSTSAVCLKRSLLEKIFPIPIPIMGCKTWLNDSYLICASLGLAKGIVLFEKLGLYRMHSHNAYMSGVGKRRRHYNAMVNILLAYCLPNRCSSLHKLGNHFMATGVGMALRNGGIPKDYQDLVKKHFSSITPITKFKIYIRVIYVFLKNPVY